ncbi:MarR family winged helix-turn-helix transcriptional regulator [Roseivivax marinus]|uniref:MarR family winged helix-turn-helix transcriptional regulator n=1 Tax=Roseivivax marinus TaxID=1379903 RepID=UPI00273F5369|nr:MarR family transcriptional regulator [Roseivivax marinus]
MQTETAEQIRDEAFSGDLRYLMALSHLVLANNQVTNRFIEQTYDMPVHAWSALYAVVHFPGVRAKEIRTLFPRPQNSISRAVSLLHRRGLLRQETMQDDNRARHLYPTDEGVALLSEIEERIGARQHEMFAPLTDDEKAEFLRLCRKVIASGKHETSEVL